MNFLKFTWFMNSTYNAIHVCILDLYNISVSNHTRWRFVKALVWPVATCGCESWTLRQADEKKLTAFENNCVRRILRIPWTAKMTNIEVWTRIKPKPEFLQHIKARKLGYFGHIVRQDAFNIEAAVATGLLPGTRSRGRPATA